MASSKEMTVGKPLTLIFSFTLPLLLGNVLQQTYSLIDAAIVGKFLGINALASVGASTSVVFLILGFCNGCCCGFGIPVAQKFGARDYETMRRYVYLCCSYNQSFLFGYSADYADAREYIQGCLSVSVGYVYRCAVYLLL